MSNLFKIIFLALMGFTILVFLTSEKPKKIVANNNIVNIIKYKSLPNSYELVGKKKKVFKNELFKKDKNTLIIVGNHDSLAVVKNISKYFRINTNLVLVANISSAPWFVKKMFIPSKLEELNKDSNIPMIYDFDGKMVNALKVTNNSKTKFFAYLLSDGVILKIYESSVKEGALDGLMSMQEEKKVLKPLVELLK